MGSPRQFMLSKGGKNRSQKRGLRWLGNSWSLRWPPHAWCWSDSRLIPPKGGGGERSPPAAGPRKKGVKSWGLLWKGRPPETARDSTLELG